jgi:5,10-methylenetetrahydrofolate reductase
MTRPLEEALARGPLFFEPVPPTARTPAARVAERADAVTELLRRTPRVDAIDVPELVDENHEGKPRYRSGDVRGYALGLQESTNRPAVVNKVVAHVASAEALEAWARETVARGLRYAVLVGGASRYIPYPGPGVVEANRLCRPVFRAAGGGLGNIAIPQRTGEAHRMLAKTRAGAAFFTTQILFDADQVVQLIREYDLLCRQAAIPPVAVVISFAPIADDQDVEFVRWLGADISESAEAAILGEDDAQVAARSERRALLVWDTVTKAARAEELSVPLGVNVEQISPRHLDTAGHLLREFAERVSARAAPV